MWKREAAYSGWPRRLGASNDRTHILDGLVIDAVAIALNLNHVCAHEKLHTTRAHHKRKESRRRGSGRCSHLFNGRNEVGPRLVTFGSG